MSKPFNEDAAKAGALVQTREGCKVRILCYDRACEVFPIVGLVTDSDGSEYSCSWTPQGFSSTQGPNKLDLVMATVKKECWINLYKSCLPSVGCRVYSTEAEAKKESGAGAIQVRIEWEE